MVLEAECKSIRDSILTYTKQCERATFSLEPIDDMKCIKNSLKKEKKEEKKKTEILTAS